MTETIGIFDWSVCKLEIRLLNTFLTVASLKNFTQAAGKLGYAQSSVTSQVQALEEALGVRLFERLGKRVALTGEGERLLPYARKILRLCQEAKDAVAPQGETKGSLAVGAPESLCAVRLLKLFTTFRNRYPDVEFSLKFGGSCQFPEMLRDNEIDVAVYIDTEQLGAELASALRLPEPIVLLASPAHRLSSAERVTPNDLAEETMFLTDPGCSYRERFLQVMAEAGARPKAIVDSGSNEVMKQLAAGGLGIALLPRVAALGELASGRLAELLWAGKPLELYTHTVYHKDKWLSPVVKAFLDLAKELLPEGAEKYG